MPAKFKPFAAKKYVPPAQKKESTQGSSESEKPKGNPDLETFEVYYTKHLHQKIKTWEEGLFCYNIKNFKGSLFDDHQKNNCIDTKYMRIKPDFSVDEEFRTNKFIVQIQVSIYQSSSHSIILIKYFINRNKYWLPKSKKQLMKD